VKPGFLLKLIDRIKDDPMPHVLILDEINRTDISRLFGELFSALEYRKVAIKLSVGDNLEIKIPENLYLIGTMNEIDFSLERIDFALRRRFIWQFKGFDSAILLEMIKEKRKAPPLKISDADIEIFIERCTKLNGKISTSPELGINYQIGHTFFAEVVDIFRSMKDRHTSRPNFLKHAVPILWEISIKPTLDAFMGNMEPELKKQQINSLQEMFING
jgi:5-methylcytosine-specific restriction protein B